MEKKKNHVALYFDAKSVNEGFARMAVMAFMTDMNPTLEQMEDVKTAVSEAVTNAIIHGYEDGEPVVAVNAQELQLLADFRQLDAEQRQKIVERFTKAPTHSANVDKNKPRPFDIAERAGLFVTTYSSSMIAISAASPRRAPIFTMRV